MTCTVCGSPLPLGAMFCGDCGSVVSAADTAALTGIIAPAEARAPATAAPGPQPSESFRLAFSTGEVLTVTSGVLLGRRPVPEPEELVDRLVAINDPGRSVSKTHLELGISAGGLWISDRYSANGTLIRHADGQRQLCEPGRRYRVERGAIVQLGEQSFTVE